ncbi:E3 ubiquitin-protein ligase RNF126-like isoform X1 [Anopheles albimanus]|nr:E3 ubiquitin-protein ligase RNF126-like isoform X1 [Anopheles albimanus]
MEAMVENSANPPPRFYCHSCSVEIDSVSPDFTCPHCSEGFIEELPAGERGAASSGGAPGGSGPESDGPPIDYVNAQLNPDTIGRLAGELLSNSFLSPLYSIYDDEPAGGSGGSGTNSTSSSYVTFPPDDIPLGDGTGGPPTAASSAGSGGVEVASGSTGTGAPGGGGSSSSSSSSSTGSGPSMHHRLAMGRRGGRRNITHLDHILREFFISVADGAPGGVPLFFMGNPGDYAWGREGIDSIVTQLLNQMDNTGPPPLEKERIAEIPTVAISEKQVEMKLQCSVCFEDFQVGESVRKLPCLHVYHEPCIIPWLELHGTCPSCRKSLTPESGSQQPGAQQATATSQQPEPMDTSQQQAVPAPESSQSQQPQQQQPQQTQEPQPGATPSQSAGSAGRQNNPNFVAFTIRDLLPILSGPGATVTTRYDPSRPSIFSSPTATGSRNASDASSQSSAGGPGSTANGGPSSGSSTNNGSNATADDDYFSLD